MDYTCQRRGKSLHKCNFRGRKLTQETTGGTFSGQRLCTLGSCVNLGLTLIDTYSAYTASKDHLDCEAVRDKLTIDYLWYYIPLDDVRKYVFRKRDKDKDRKTVTETDRGKRERERERERGGGVRERHL